VEAAFLQKITPARTRVAVPSGAILCFSDIKLPPLTRIHCNGLQCSDLPDLRPWAVDG
jgi:hypothetical protein